MAAPAEVAWGHSQQLGAVTLLSELSSGHGLCPSRAIDQRSFRSHPGPPRALSATSGGSRPLSHDPNLPSARAGSEQTKPLRSPGSCCVGRESEGWNLGLLVPWVRNRERRALQEQLQPIPSSEPTLWSWGHQKQNWGGSKRQGQGSSGGAEPGTARPLLGQGNG